MQSVPAIGIRDATIADSEGIAQLVTDLGYRTSPGQMCKRLEAILHDEEYNTLVAWEDERIVGFIGTRLGPLYESDDLYGQIMALAVATDHRRRGVGRTLMQTAESILAQRGARVLVVTSGNHRADAHASTRSMGTRGVADGTKNLLRRPLNKPLQPRLRLRLPASEAKVGPSDSRPRCQQAAVGPNKND